MVAIERGRRTADAPDGTVVFLIGTRINRPWQVWQWLPVFVAMPRMLRELAAHPELGLLGAKPYLGGLTALVVQYWRSAEALNAYAAATDHEHLPAWREFNRRTRGNAAVGVFHETYVLGGASETIYVGMPLGSGLAGATANVPVGRRGERAAHRLDPTVPDLPGVPGLSDLPPGPPVDAP